MDKNLAIGILAAVIVVGGGAWILTSSSPNSGTTATTSGATTSSTQSAPTAAAAPTVTTSTLAVASNSSAVLAGKVIPNGLQTSYWYEYGQTSALGTRSSVQSIGSGFASISAPVFITGLSANTSYSYQLVAENALGTVTGSIYSFTTNNNPAPVGNAPTTSTNPASGVSRTSANLSGNINPDGASTTYWFEYGQSSDLGNTTTFQSAGSGDGSVSGSVSVSGLEPSTTYYFRINAQNQFGTVNGTILTFTTSGPTVPGAPSANTNSASNITPATATLNGTVNPNGASTTYWFEYSSDSLLGNVLGTTTHQAVTGSGTNPISISSNVTGLAHDTTYYYRLVTTNSYGTTEGGIASFTTSH